MANSLQELLDTLKDLFNPEHAYFYPALAGLVFLFVLLLGLICFCCLLCRTCCCSTGSASHKPSPSTQQTLPHHIPAPPPEPQPAIYLVTQSPSAAEPTLHAAMISSLRQAQTARQARLAALEPTLQWQLQTRYSVGSIPEIEEQSQGGTEHPPPAYPSAPKYPDIPPPSYWD